MQPPRSLALLACLAALLSGRASAQTALAASESHVMSARVTAGASGAAAGQLFAASRVSVGFAAASSHASSSNHELVAGLALVPAQLSPGPPVVLGLTPDAGDSDGGTPVKILGFNLHDPLAPTVVTFDGAAAPLVTVQGNTVLDVLTPAGENAFGNPLASVDVDVQTSPGSASASDAYAYLPALSQQASGCFGCTLVVELAATPGAFHMLARGSIVPGFALPIPPVEGALEIASGVVLLTGLSSSASGTVQYQLPIPALTVPPFQVDLQAVALDSLVPLGGSFTNRLTVTIGP